jgi:hypothetical protein
MARRVSVSISLPDSRRCVGPPIRNVDPPEDGDSPATPSSALAYPGPLPRGAAHDESKIACGEDWPADLRVFRGTAGSSPMFTIRPTPHIGQRVAHRVSVTPTSRLRGVANARASGDMTSGDAAAPSNLRQTASFSRRCRLHSSP